jgi:hypothetical protein
MIVFHYTFQVEENENETGTFFGVCSTNRFCCKTDGFNSFFFAASRPTIA